MTIKLNQLNQEATRVELSISPDGTVARAASGPEGAPPPGETFWVDYSPGRITAATEDAMFDADSTKRQLGGMCKLLATVLVDWDVTGADGEPYPLDEAHLRELPGIFIAGVVNAVLSEQRPDPEA